MLKRARSSFINFVRGGKSPDPAEIDADVNTARSNMGSGTAKGKDAHPNPAGPTSSAEEHENELENINTRNHPRQHAPARPAYSSVLADLNDLLGAACPPSLVYLCLSPHDEGQTLLTLTLTLTLTITTLT